MLLVYLVDIRLQLLYLLIDELLDLIQPILYLHQDHIVTQVGLQLRLLSMLGKLQLAQTLLQQRCHLSIRLRPLHKLIIKFMPLPTHITQLVVVIAVGGSTYPYNLLGMQFASS